LTHARPEPNPNRPTRIAIHPEGRASLKLSAPMTRARAKGMSADQCQFGGAFDNTKGTSVARVGRSIRALASLVAIVFLTFAAAARANCADDIRDAETRLKGAGVSNAGPQADKSRQLEAWRRLDLARSQSEAGGDETYCQSLVRSAQESMSSGGVAPSAYPPLGSGGSRVFMGR
jgi:hypothetical protein